MGVPVLLDGSPGSIQVARILSGLADQIRGIFSPWGIYATGTGIPAVKVDSVVEMGLKAGSRVATYMIQDGGFVTYDKVKEPIDVSIRITKGYSTTLRSELLTWLEVNREAVTVYDIVTPEKTYIGYTLMNYTYERKADSTISLIVADCVFREVRQIEETYTVTKSTVNNPQPVSTRNAANACVKPSGFLVRENPQTPSTNAASILNTTLNWR